jgi:hypothetical protein
LARIEKLLFCYVFVQSTEVGIVKNNTSLPQGMGAVSKTFWLGLQTLNCKFYQYAQKFYDKKLDIIRLLGTHYVHYFTTLNKKLHICYESYFSHIQFQIPMVDR